MADVLITEALTVGGSQTTPAASSLRLDGLATTGGTPLFRRANGDVVVRSIGTGDLPSSLMRKDSAAGLQSVNAAVSIANTLTVSRSTILSNTLSVSGATTLSSTLGVTGNTALFGHVNVMTTLHVTSDATLSNTDVGALLRVSGSTGLPNTTTSHVYITGGHGSPISGRMWIGDRTGWSLRMSTRNAGVNADSHIFSDNGRLEIGQDILPMTAGSGNVGLTNRKWLSLHASEMWVSTLVAEDVMSTIGGRVLVGPTTTLAASINASTTTITTRHNNLTTGYRVYLEGGGQFECMVIQSTPSGSGPYTYTVTRNYDGSGGNSWDEGSAILNTGVTGHGFIDLYSQSGITSGSQYGPTIVGNVRANNNWNGIEPRWAAGNLNGLYGYSANAYGFAAGVASGPHVTIDSTDGIKIKRGGETHVQVGADGWLRLGDASAGQNIVISPSSMVLRTGSTPQMTLSSAGISMTGNLAIGSSGHLSIGATGYQSGTGVWMDAGGSGGAGRLYAGNGSNASSQYIAWSGSALSVRGDLAASSGLQIWGGSSGAGHAIHTGSMANMRLINSTVAGTIELAASGGVILGSGSGTIRPSADGGASLGTSSYRWNSIHMNLPAATASAITYVAVSDTTAPTRLGYVVGAHHTEVINGKTFVWRCGILISVT